jgi:hypothetical protein
MKRVARDTDEGIMRPEACGEILVSGDKDHRTELCLIPVTG